VKDDESRDDLDDIVAGDRISARLLEQPISSWIDLQHVIDVEAVTRLFLREFRRSVDDGDGSRILNEAFRSMLERYDNSNQTLRELLPERFVDSLKRLVKRDYYADRQLVRAFVDHAAMRTVIDRVLRHTLMQFTERVTDWIQETGSIPGLRGTIQFVFSLFGRARTYANRFSEEFETRIQSRIDDFVEDIIDEVVAQVIDQLSSEDLAGEFSQWRQDLVDVVLDQPVNRYAQEIQKLAPERTARDVTDILRNLADWKEFDQVVRQLVKMAIDAFGEQSIADVLKGIQGGETVKEVVEERLSVVFEDLGADDRAG
jgi:hypothetical protein